MTALDRKAHPLLDRPREKLHPELIDGYIVKRYQEESNFLEKLWDLLEDYLLKNFIVPSIEMQQKKRSPLNLKSYPELIEINEFISRYMDAPEMDFYLEDSPTADICLDNSTKWGIIVSGNFFSDAYSRKERVFLMAKNRLARSIPRITLLKTSSEERIGLFRLLMEMGAGRRRSRDRAGRSTRS